MKDESAWDISYRTVKSSLVLFSLFLAFGLWTGLTRDIRYLFVFLYLGGGIALGGFLGGALPRKHRTWGRRINAKSTPKFTSRPMNCRGRKGVNGGTHDHHYSCPE